MSEYTPLGVLTQDLLLQLFPFHSADVAIKYCWKLFNQGFSYRVTVNLSNMHFAVICDSWPPDSFGYLYLTGCQDTGNLKAMSLNSLPLSTIQGAPDTPEYMCQVIFALGFPSLMVTGTLPSDVMLIP